VSSGQIMVSENFIKKAVNQLFVHICFSTDKSSILWCHCQ